MAELIAVSRPNFDIEVGKTVHKSDIMTADQIAQATEAQKENKVPAASAIVMYAADKTKLDGITEDADAVSVSRNLTSGTKIGTITVNGVGTDLYCETNTDTTYSDVTTSAHGLMSSSDKSKLDGIAASADAVSFAQNLTSGTKVGTITINGTGTDLYCTNDTTYSAATTSAAGLMSASDKSKLDGITASADTVSFTRNLTSGTKVGTITINGTGTDIYCNNDTNTTYSAATQSAQGLMSAADKVKLDGITSSADTVAFSRSLSSGTKIGTITINGSGTDLYCNNDTNTTYSASTGLALSGTAFYLSSISSKINLTSESTSVTVSAKSSASFSFTKNVGLSGATHVSVTGATVESSDAGGSYIIGHFGHTVSTGHPQASLSNGVVTVSGKIYSNCSASTTQVVRVWWVEYI